MCPPNEIGMFIPLLDGINIRGKDITADALLTLPLHWLHLFLHYATRGH
jgi:hypothetical protein